MKQSISFDVFDQESAASFHQYMSKYPRLYQKLATILRKELSDSSSQARIVDIGMGPGLLLEQIHKALPQSCLIGIDQSQAMINQAKKTTIHNASFMQANTESLPICSNTIDAVTCRFVLYSLKHTLRAIQELFRILKPGGIIVIEALNKQYSPWKKTIVKINMTFKQASNAVISYHFDAYHDAYSSDKLIAMLEQVGFKMKRKQGKPKEWKYLLIATK